MIKIRDINIGKDMVFVAGPCVIENYDMVEETARYLADLVKRKNLKVILKLSYDKANRTSGDSFRGIGLDKGLEVISKIRDKFNLPILVDVHCKYEVEKVAEVCDCIQIPAFLCRQTDLLAAAGRTGKPVNIKKGQFMSPWAMARQAEKARQSPVILTERGASFGYGELVVDMRSIIIMKNAGYPVFFDATHSQQRPPTDKPVTSGRREFIIPLAKAARVMGADGIYCEIHPKPNDAKSDRDTQLGFDEFTDLVDAVCEL